MNHQSDCIPLEDKLKEIKAACKEKSLKQVIALTNNLDIVNTSSPEWQVVIMALE